MTWRIFEPLIAALVAITILGGAAYIRIMFEGKIDARSVVEAANYSVQTVTTVGYGNWVPPGVPEDDPRILIMKLISVPFMLSGPLLFGTVVAFVANLVIVPRV